MALVKCKKKRISKVGFARLFVCRGKAVGWQGVI